ADARRIEAHIVPERYGQGYAQGDANRRRRDQAGTRGGARLRSRADPDQDGGHAEEVRAPQWELDHGMDHLDPDPRDDPPRRRPGPAQTPPANLPPPAPKPAERKARARQPGLGEQVQRQVVGRRPDFAVTRKRRVEARLESGARKLSEPDPRQRSV